MRIFYFARIDIEGNDAGARHVLETCKQFASNGHETVLFIPDLGATRKIPGVSIVKVPVLIRNPAFTYFSFHAVLFLYLLYYCLTNKPDAIYTRQQSLEWWATWLKVIFRFRYAIEVNGLPLIELKMSQASGWITSVTRIMEWICYRFPDFWVVPTTHIRDFLCKEYSLDPKLFLVVSNGADENIFYPMDQSSCRDQLGLSANAKYLLFMGGFKRWHGILELIEIMPDLIDSNLNIKLLLVGEGELTAGLRVRVDALGIKDNVIFCGRRPLAEMPEFINAADICLAPFFDERSPHTGLSPLKLFEYMACGKPVIASALGGLDKIFQAHDMGEVVSSTDPKVWTATVLSLLNNPERMRSCGENGRRAVLEKFNWKTISENILNHLAGN
ncbi:MAG: glycosyltransferase involved in cell wall biosynthesis [Nitrospinales bacterium]|jgi:glycosyltransferase involved in cell wall biosynthesis